VSDDWANAVNEPKVLGGWHSQGVSIYNITNTKFVAVEVCAMRKQTLYEFSA
jgi:hypothetical protein